MEKGIWDWYLAIKARVELHLAEAKAANSASEKLTELCSQVRRVIIPITPEMHEWNRTYKRTLWGFFLGSAACTLILARKVFPRVMIFSVLGVGGIRGLVQPHFENWFYEKLMEEQTEAAQVVRSVYLFKCPQHPLSEHYRSLSREYKTYAKIKRSQSPSIS